MKKIICTLLCIAMLLSCCAFAEGGSITISKIQVSQNGQQIIALENTELKLGGGIGENGFGVFADLIANGNVLVEGSARLGNDGVILSLDDMLSNDFVISADQISELTGTIDFNDMLGGAQFDISEIDVEALTNAAFELIQKVGSSFEDLGTVTYDEKQCEAVGFAVKNDDIFTFLGAIATELDKMPQIKDALAQAAGVEMSLADLMASVPVKLDVDGTLYGAEGFSAYVLGLHTTVPTEDEANPEEQIDFELVIESEDGGIGTEGIEVGCAKTDYEIKLSQVAGDQKAELMEIEAEVGMLNEAFGYLEAEMSVADQDILAIEILAPQVTADHTFDMQVNFPGGIFQVQSNDGYFYLLIGTEEQSFDVMYEGGKVTATFDAGADHYEATFNVAFSAEDDAWISAPAENPLDLLSMTEEQSQKITEEISSNAMSLLMGIMAAEPSLMSLLGM